MRKLGTMIVLLLTAGSAFAGDFEQAQNAGFDSTKGPAALIAFALVLVGGTVVFLWKQFRGTRAPIATATAIIATMLTLHAGDFANAADSGYGPSNNMWNRFGSWFGSFWTSHFSWENGTASFGQFTPVPSATPHESNHGGNGTTPPRQQN